MSGFRQTQQYISYYFYLDEMFPPTDRHKAIFKKLASGACSTDNIHVMWHPEDLLMFISVINQLKCTKFCTSSWLITEINILRCTVKKTSNLNYRGRLTRLALTLAMITEGKDKPLKNTLGLRSVVSCACKLIVLFFCFTVSGQRDA